MSAGVFPKVQREVITLADYNNLQALAFSTKTTLLGEPCLSSQKTAPAIITQADWNNLKADLDYCIAYGALTTGSITTKLPFTPVVAADANQYSANANYADALVQYKINITLSTSTTTFSLPSALSIGGYTGARIGKSAITITVTTNTVVGSTSTIVPSLAITGTNVSDTISIYNFGRITGRGGAGGRGANYGGSAVAGSAGGTAIRILQPVTVFNYSVVAGGGGGGGGGGYYAVTSGGKTPTTTTYAGDGGGGGAGLLGGAAGAGGGGANVNGTAGAAGTTTAGGGSGGNAGAGGAPGVAGGGGANTGAAVGGAAGKYIEGNSFATWISTGTRLGTFV